MAEVLQRAGFPEEAVAPLCDAILAMGRALAVEQRLPVPTELAQVGLAPLAVYWGSGLAEIQAFAESGAQPELAAAALRRLVGGVQS